MKKNTSIYILVILFIAGCSAIQKKSSQEMTQSPKRSRVDYENPMINEEAQTEELEDSVDADSYEMGEALQAPAREFKKSSPRLGWQIKESNTESYEKYSDNKFRSVDVNPLSTFSIDVDTASYSNMRRMINHGSLPPRAAIRIEEMINYFPYKYQAPNSKKPLAVHVDAYSAPWNPEHHLVRIALKGKELKKNDIKPSNLVFLLDVSGSMDSPNKLPLLKSAFRKLVENLDGRDKVSIVVYAGASGVVLEPTAADNKTDILNALDRLTAGGSTNGGDGIELAYQLAQQNFIRNGNNRVILATDGDFNVGLTSHEELLKLIKRKADGGVFLSLLGFGMGNYKDSLMEKISNNGNGNYFYIDTIKEAEKVLVNQLSATLFTIAKDVKIQVEFNPAYVESYRLIGYENRIMAAQDFANDRKDAGEIGAGFTVTALYELIPTGVSTHKNIKLKYQKNKTKKNPKGKDNGELLTVKLRYKMPDESRSKLMAFPFKKQVKNITSAPNDLKFASAVAEFGMILRNSPYKANSSMQNALSRAKLSLGNDDGGYRREFVQLVELAMRLKR